MTDIAYLPEARLLQNQLEALGQFEIGIQSPGIATEPGSKSTIIRLETDPAPVVLPPDSPSFKNQEAYRLRTDTAIGGRLAKGIRIQASTSTGIFNGMQTLLQILAGSRIEAEGGSLQIPVVDIQDYPRFAWRGSMLDSSRHFIALSYLKRHLDLMANFKLNVFHWHLSDDQGWRFPVDGLDRLTEIGAWRKRAEPDGPLEPYGGFYTHSEIQELVDYAAQRHIMIVPEVDMPGHASAAIAAYPAIACSGPGAPQVQAPLSAWGIFGNNLCPGKEASFDFVKRVVTQLVALFPGAYIHFGGDEVHDIASWQSCPDCRAKMNQLGFEEARQLERYFIGRVEQIIRDNDRIPIAWDDVVHSVSQTSTLLQFWSNENNLLEGREIGFQFVLSPGSYTYLDMNYAAPEIRRWAGFISIAHAYSLDPAIWELDDSAVRGIEAPLWTEHLSTEAAMDHHLWPRLSALAEVAWTAAKRRDWASFAQRLATQGPLLDQRGLGFYRSPEIEWNPSGQ